MRDRHRQKNPKNRKTKVHLVFDEESRKEFLTGFRRRKLDRKKFHQKRLAEQHKEAVRQMRRERKKALEESVNLNLQFPDEKLEKELSSQNQEVHDLPDHTVTVTSVTDLDLSSTPGGLGPPELEYESDESEDTIHKEDDEEDEDDDFGFPLTHREMKVEEEPREIPIEQTENIPQKRKRVFHEQKSSKKRPRKVGTQSNLHRRKRKRLATSRKHINYTKKR